MNIHGFLVKENCCWRIKPFFSGGHQDWGIKNFLEELRIMKKSLKYWCIAQGKMKGYCGKRSFYFRLMFSNEKKGKNRRFWFWLGFWIFCCFAYFDRKQEARMVFWRHKFIILSKFHINRCHRNRASSIWDLKFVILTFYSLLILA